MTTNDHHEAVSQSGARPRVVLGVTGGIAAYKACELTRRFTESGHDVTVVPTAAALQFVGAATWAALSGKPVSAEVWTDVHEVPHVRIGQEADLVVVAPATADVLAKAAHGLADDLLTNTLLTARCPVVFAPAMHTEMWEHAATQANVATLRQRGAVVIEPAEGRLTGKDTGKGRLPEPAEIFELALEVLARGVAELPTSPAATSWCPPAAPASTSTRSASSATGRRASRGTPWPAPRPPAAPRSPWSAPTSAFPDPAGVKVVRVETTGQLRDAVVGARLVRRRRGDGRRARRLPAHLDQRQQDQEVRRRLRAGRRADPEPRHPPRDLAPADPRGLGHRRLRRRDRRRAPAPSSTWPAPSWPARAATCWSSTTSAGERSSAAPTTKP